MDGLFYTAHAAARMNQRGIREEEVESLFSFGKSERSRGADVYFMDREARTQALNELGPKAFARLEKKFNAHLVVADDGTLVTAAKRLRRIRA